MVLQFVPNASKETIDSLLTRRDLKVIDTFPKLGAVKVEVNLNRYFTTDVSDNSANDTLLRGVNKAIEDFGTSSTRGRSNRIQKFGCRSKLANSISEPLGADATSKNG
jgi:hypothetical protein